MFRREAGATAVVLSAVLFALTACSSSPARTSGSGQRPLPPATGAASGARSGAGGHARLPVGVLASIPVGTGVAPTSVAVGFGSVWVAGHRGDRIVRIDPRTNKVIATISVGESVCGQLVIAFGRVWAQPCDVGVHTAVIDPATNEVVGTVDAGAITVAIADGSLWSRSLETNDLVRIDPKTLKITKDVPVETVTPSFISYGAGLIWLAPIAFSDGTWKGGPIEGIDPKTNKVVKKLVVPDPGFFPWMTFAYGHLWITSYSATAVLRVDPSTGVIKSFPVPKFKQLSQFLDVAVTGNLGGIWFRSSDGTVTRLDARTGKPVATYPADPAGGGGYVAVAFGSLWIANFGTDTVWRDQLK